MKGKPLFYKKIICIHCNGNFKKKVERGKVKYLCRNYDSGSSCSVRVVLEESFLKSLLDKHYGYELSEDEVKQKVEKIVVEDKLLFEIELSDSENIVFGRNFIRY